MKLKLQAFFAKKENLYLSLALTFGFLMVFINPPFAGVPDEHAHYWKAWSVANGYWRCSGSDEIPTTAVSLPDQIKPIKYEGIKDSKIVVAKLKEKLFEKDNAERSAISGAACPGTPFGYVSQILGLKMGQSLGFSALAEFYLARIFALLASVAVLYWAIKIVPFGKMIFVLLGLTPLVVRQFASMSYDGLAISLAALFLAYILKLSVEKNKLMARKNMALLVLLSLFGLNVKIGYFVMSFLIFILPMEKFKKKWQYWAFTLGFIVINFAMIFAIRATFIDIAQPKWTDPQKQMEFVLSAPLHFLNVAFGSYYGADGFIPHIAGIVFKTGVYYSMHGIFYVLFFLGVLIFLRNQEEKVELSKKQRLILLAVFLANFLIIYLALYLGWSKPGAKGVSGVQGRYFLAIIPMLIFAFYKSGFSLEFAFVKKYQNALLLFFAVITFWFVFSAIYEAHYLKEVKPSNPVYEKFLEKRK